MTSKRKVLQQLSKERKDLLGKIDRLAQFIVKDGPKLSSPLELTLLNAQLRSMQTYLENLDARIIYMRGTTNDQIQWRCSYSESGSGIKATSRILFNEAQVTAIKSIARDEFNKQADYGIVYVVKDMKLDDYGKLELIHVFEELHDAQRYAADHPRAVIIPREVQKHDQIKK